MASYKDAVNSAFTESTDWIIANEELLKVVIVPNLWGNAWERGLRKA
jgi:hypothetical protein